MPQELMQWGADERWLRRITTQEAPPEYRRQYRLSPRRLRKRYPDLVTGLTRDGSRRAANQFWCDLQAEIRSKIVPPTWQEITERAGNEWGNGGVSDRTMAEFRRLEAITFAPADKILATIRLDEPPTERQRAIVDAVNTAAGFGELNSPLIPTEKQLKTWRERFLEKKRATISAASVVPMLSHLPVFVNFIGEESDATTINETHAEDFYNLLRGKIEADEISTTYANNVCTTVKGFLRYLYEMRQIELPRNMNLLAFAKEADPNPLTVPTLRKIIEGAEGELRAWLLTMCNLCCTQGDLSKLSPDKVDWKKGFIKRKRAKTEMWKNVPLVNHKLWAETFALLKAHGCKNGDIVFQHEGKPLVYGRTDKVGTEFKKLVESLEIEATPKQIRKTIATILGNHKEYNQYSNFYGGWAPTSVADKHYKVPSQDILDEMVGYVGKQLGLK